MQALKAMDQVLHQQALTASENFRKSEAALIEILQQIDERKVYLALGHGSLFEYAVSLNLSEANAYAFCAIARKARVIPEIKAEIQNGNLSVSKARRILPVITIQNKSEWIQKAENLSKRDLEKEVFKANPALAKRETLRRVQENRVSLNFSVSDELMAQLKRAQNILSTKKRKNMNLEESLSALVTEFLERNDPTVKAKRVLEKKEETKSPSLSPCSKVMGKEDKETLLKNVSLSSSHPNHTKFGPGPKREHIPMQVKHQLRLRDKNQCTYVSDTGRKCENERWLEFHHLQPVAMGGGNELTNLKTICRAHHAYFHA